MGIFVMEPNQHLRKDSQNNVRRKTRKLPAIRPIGAIGFEQNIHSRNDGRHFIMYTCK